MYRVKKAFKTYDYLAQISSMVWSLSWNFWILEWLVQAGIKAFSSKLLSHRKTFSASAPAAD